MHHTENQHVAIFETVHDDVFSNREAAQALSELTITDTARSRKSSKKKESVCDRVD